MRRTAALAILALLALLPAPASGAACQLGANTDGTPLTMMAGGMKPRTILYFTELAGVPAYAASYTPLTWTPAVTANATGYTIESEYRSDPYIVVDGSYNASGGLLYWYTEAPAWAATAIVGGGVVGAHAYRYTINNTAPDPDALASPVLLPIAPLYSMVYESQASRWNLTADAVFFAPAAAQMRMDEVVQAGGTLDWMSFTAFPVSMALTPQGRDAVRLMVAHAVYVELAYTLDGNQNTDVYATFMLAYALVNTTSGSVIDAGVLLHDLTYDQDGYLVRNANTVGEDFDYSRVPAPHVFFGTSYTIVDPNGTATTVTGVRFTVAGDLVTVYQSALGVYQMTLFDTARIVDPDTGDPVSYVALRRWTELYVSWRSPGSASEALHVNRTAWEAAVNATNHTTIGDPAVGFLPVVYAVESGGQITIRHDGLLALATWRARNLETGADVLIVVPYLLAGSVDAAPQVYKRLYNGGVPYAVYLTYPWSQMTARQLSVSGWRVAGFIYNGTGYEPVLYARIFAKDSDGVSLYANVLDLAWIIAYGGRVNLTIDKWGFTSYIGQAVISTAPIARIMNYTLGPGKQAATLDELAQLPSWIRVSQTFHTPAAPPTIEYYYSDDLILTGDYFGSIFIAGGTLGLYSPQPPYPILPAYTMSAAVVANATVAVSVSVQGYNGLFGFIERVEEGPYPGHPVELLGFYPGVAYLAGAAVYEATEGPVELALPPFAEAFYAVGRHGFSYRGTLIVGDAPYLFVNSTIGSWAPAAYPTRTTSAPDCDVVNVEVCFNLTSSPGTVLAVVTYTNEMNVSVFDFSGSLQALYAYYYDANVDNLSKVTICEGDCGEAAAPCGAILVPPGGDAYGLTVDSKLVALELVYPTGPAAPGPQPPPAANITVTLPPPPGQLSKPGFTAPKAVMTAMLFIAFYAFFAKRMTTGEALAAATSLTGVASLVFWGQDYLLHIITFIGVGLVLYYYFGR